MAAIEWSPHSSPPGYVTDISEEHMAPILTSISATDFRSLADVDVPLAPFSVLVGPNGSGKSNLLKAVQFVATFARNDLDEALALWGGFRHVHRQSTDAAPRFEVRLEGRVTEFASAGAPDSYTLTVGEFPGLDDSGALWRHEEFVFKRTEGRGRRIRVEHADVVIDDEHSGVFQKRLADEQTSGLSVLSRLDEDEIGAAPLAFADFLSSIRNLEPDVVSARLGTRAGSGGLDDDASNLATALKNLRDKDADAFRSLVVDVSRCLPGLEDVTIETAGGSATTFVVELVESGLSAPIPLADASFGTVRLLALLTALHDPEPPAFTAIEEVDHGLHPYALDLLVDRMREASGRTQILAASHSPTLVNRLAPEEIIICDRDPATGESIIPAREPEEIAAAMANFDHRAGELWFAGVLGGVPQ